MSFPTDVEDKEDDSAIIEKFESANVRDDLSRRSQKRSMQSCQKRKLNHIYTI